MKKLLSILVITCILFSMKSNIAKAQSTPTVPYEIEYISEDLYIETIIIIHENNTTRSTTTVSASKVSNIKNNDGDILTSFKLTGTFLYTHTSSWCSNASCTTTIYDDTWKFTSTSATKSGISAIGSYTAAHYVLGVPIDSVSRNLSISCDAHGNVY